MNFKHNLSQIQVQPIADTRMTQASNHPSPLSPSSFPSSSSSLSNSNPPGNTQMNPPSEEQQLIIEYVKQGYSVVVDAVAGSGKTTTVLNLATQLAPKKVLQVTYNAALKFEVRKKAIKYNITNLEVHSYHSLAVNYFHSHCYNDIQMKKMLHKQQEPKKYPQFDILVIDECQDMTELYFSLVCRLFTLSKLAHFQLVCCGDRWQSIYQFKDADARFLTMAQELWPFLRWKECSLRESYRLTTCMSEYVNQCLLGNDRIIAKRPGNHPNVDVWYGNMFKIAQELALLVIEWIKQGKYKPSDFYILCYSTKASKGERPSQKIENILKKANPPIPILVPGNETDQLTADLIADKLIITTFHQSKGNERKVVVLLNFDQSFFTYNARDTPDHICPSLIYVAATRASEHLIITHGQDTPKFKFQSMDFCDETVRPNFINYIERKTKKSTKTSTTTTTTTESASYTVTELTNFIDKFTIRYMYEIDDCFQQVCEPAAKQFVVPSQIECTVKYKTQREFDVENNSDVYQDEQDDKRLKLNDGNKQSFEEITSDEKKQMTTTESVSSLNGYFFPLYLECKLNQHNGIVTLPHMIWQNQAELHNLDPYRKKSIERVCSKKTSELTIYDMLFLCNLYDVVQNKYIYRLSQISSYNWIPQRIADLAVATMYERLKHQMSYFEQTVSVFWNSHFLTGRVDCIVQPSKQHPFITIYEFKYTATLEIEHRLQLLLYGFLYICNIEITKRMNSNIEETKLNSSHVWSAKTMNLPIKLHLYNFRTGEEWVCNFSQVNKVQAIRIVQELLMFKKQPGLYNKTNEQFLHEMQAYLTEIK